MKFNDGFWLLKNGIKPFYGLQVVQLKNDATGYDLRVATRPIRHRGDTLGGKYGSLCQIRVDYINRLPFTGPVLSVRVHSPTQGVIGVKIEHIVHGDSPELNIRLFPDAPPIQDASLQSTNDKHSLKSGDLVAEITENPYAITFKSPNRVLTEAGVKHQAVFDVPARWTMQSASYGSCLANDPVSNPRPEVLPPVVKYIHSELKISPGELIYGLGEQFGPFVKNGKQNQPNSMPKF